MSASARDATALPARPISIPAPTHHPPEDVFERVYAATIARGAGADLDDLLERARRFRANADAIRDEPDRRRWAAFAGGVERAVLALRERAPERAELHLRRGLRTFIVSTRARCRVAPMDPDLERLHFAAQRLKYGLPVESEEEAAFHRALDSDAGQEIAAQLVESVEEFREALGDAFRRAMHAETPLPRDEERLEIFGAMIDRAIANPRLADETLGLYADVFRKLTELAGDHPTFEGRDVAAFALDKLLEIEATNPELAREIRERLALDDDSG